MFKNKLKVIKIMSILLFINTANTQTQTSIHDSVVGEYYTSIVANRALFITQNKGELFVESKGQGIFKLVRKESDTYEIEGYPMQIVFLLKDEKYNSFIFKNKGNDKTYTKIEILNEIYHLTSKKIRPNGLSDSVLMGDLESAKALINAGVDLEELDTRPTIAGTNGRRPLNWAALENNIEFIALLLKAGADINLTNLSGFTPLHHAVEAGSLEAARFLLTKGANPNAVTKKGKTLLEIAATKDNNEMINLLQSAMSKK